MQPITERLLAASTRWGSRPYVALDIRDERPRWRTLLAGPSSGHSSQIVVAQSYLLRARVTSAGLGIARVYQPALGGAEWTAWTPQHTLPNAGSDVALTVVGPFNISTNCRAFFMRGTDLMVSESATGFASPVGTASLVQSGLSADGWLAGADVCAFYGANGSALRVWRKAWAGGAWAEGSPWPLGAMGVCYGVGAAWDPLSARAVVLAAKDGAIIAALYDPASDAWSGLIQLAPGGTAGAGSGASYRLPSACFAGDRIVAGWVEALSVSSLRTRAVSCEARVYPHFGAEVALDLRGGSSYGRPNLAYWWSAYQVYAADEGSACLRTRYAGLPDTAHEVLGLEPAAYHLQANAGGSRLTLRLPNADGRYNRFGTPGSAYEAFKLHSTLILRRGYIVNGGAETLPLAPHYLLGARLLEGRGGGWLEIEAGDGRALLGSWYAGEALAWEGRSLRWLIEELCARAGLGYRDNGAAVLANAAARYLLPLGASALQGAEDLLRLAGCTARMTAEGLYALPAAAWATAAPARFGQQGEIRRAAYGAGLPDATDWLVYGTAADGWAEDPQRAMALGQRQVRARVDERISTPAWAAAVAAAELRISALAARREVLTVPLRPELEVWDPAAVYGAQALTEGAARRITGIAELWDAAGGRYETALELGAG